MSPKEDKQLNKFVDENLRLQRIIQTDSLYASRFFFIKKKDGKLQPVQDYHELNKWTVPSQYPLPLIEDIVHKFAGKKWFSKFDVWWGYNNQPIIKDDQWKAAFKIKRGLFKPIVMFFGLCNSPTTFQGFMDDAFCPEIDSGDYRIYMDNVLVATDGTLKEHIKKVHHILDRMWENDLFLKLSKCTFYKKEIEYLRLIISNGKVQMDPVKVQGIAQWPAPTTVKGIRSFLGFCNFYRAFIPKFSDITHPLNDLTKKNQQWQWQDKEQQAFNELKCICITQPVLHAPNWNKPFIMETDASGYALGAVIAQLHDNGIHPIAFHSCSLAPAERNYDAHDKEMLGIIYGLKMGRKFFLGMQELVQIWTNHKNLQYFCEPQKLTRRQARWIMIM